MKLYRLPFVIHEPGEDTEDQYMAETPSLQGCRAWGATAAEAMENLQGVATRFIESYADRRDLLPPEVESAPQGSTGPSAIGEVLVAV